MRRPSSSAGHGRHDNSIQGVKGTFGKNTLLLSVTPENDALFLVSSRTAVANIFLFYFFPSITQYLGRH